MENEGIQRLLKAEEDAAKIIQRARDERQAKLRQAQTDAEKSSQELRRQLERELQQELQQKDAGDSAFAAQLKNTTAKEVAEIDAGYNKNQAAVVDFLLQHVTSVHLEVSEALRQSLLTKAEQGLQ